MSIETNPIAMEISSIDDDIAKTLIDTTSIHASLNSEILERCRILLQTDRDRLLKLLEITQDKITWSAISLIEPPTNTIYWTPIPKDENFHDPKRQSDEKILLSKYEALELAILLDLRKILNEK